MAAGYPPPTGETGIRHGFYGFSYGSTGCFTCATVTASSTGGQDSVMPRRVVYAGSPAHLVAMSQTLAAELEDTGVQVQVLCPGVVTAGLRGLERTEPRTRLPLPGPLTALSCRRVLLG
ncbi:SDR family NAD(P)-dependent oxidoreductase [Streptomyces sp900129855]|uniref:SDR family NAD(P)-dependent oxidoreductase n=1 Tax=Streptomyces sp. 900129855 TaxID=3155129 RepID=A0ABV2ZQY2_9ACTN